MKNLLILFLLSIGFTASLSAQADNWLMVTRIGSNQETCSQDYVSFPDNYIKQKQSAGEFITDLVYSPSGWKIVTGKGKYTKQKYKRSAEFPEAFIEKSWEEGYNISSVAYGNGEWVVVMSNYLVNDQTWTMSYDKADIAKEIKKNWATHSISHMAYGEGGWCLVMTSGIGHVGQTYDFKANLPMTWIKQKQGEGKNITVAAYGNGEWFITMSSIPNKSADEMYFGTIWNQNFLNKAYNGNRRISILHYAMSDNSAEDEIQEYMAAGDASYENGDYDDAIENYNYVVYLDPNNVDAYCNLVFCKVALEQCKGALSLAQKAYKLDPNNFTVLFTRGLAYGCNGQSKLAIADLTAAIKLDATQAIAYAYRASLYELEENYAAALADYKKAKQLDPSDKELNQHIARLEKLNKPTPSIVKATMTWDNPINAVTTSNKAIFPIKVCVQTQGQNISKVQILQNGQPINYNFASRGLTVEDDCSATIQHNISLINGANKIEILVTTASGTVRSEVRTINYQAPNNNNNNNTIANSGSNYHAILIGVSNYNDMGIKNLDRPAKDIVDLKNVLTSQYTFRPGDIHMLANPTKDQILNKLTELQDKLTTKDNLLIFYAGHGVVKNQVGYWLPSDATNASRTQWLSNAELKDYINGFKAQHVLVIADACFSGALITGGYRDMAQFACEQMGKVPSRRAMTSGANTVVPDNSVFFDYLLKRLQDNTSSCFTAEDLYTKIKPAVINNSPNQQLPQFGALPQTGDEGGNFIFKKK